MKALKEHLESIPNQGIAAADSNKKLSTPPDSMEQSEQIADNNDRVSPADIEEFLFPDDNLN